MHDEVLSESQKSILPLIKSFSPDFYLAGGTALALHLGHRKSIDFDLFTSKQLDAEKIKKTIRTQGSINSILFENSDELTLVVNGVKLTYLYYPFIVKATENFSEIILLPNILSLSAMKAYSLSRRAKWKDYIDLFFVLKKYSLAEIADKAREIFKNEFNERLLREQLAYFEDIDYSEKVNFLPGFEIKDEEIKNFLIEKSIENR